MFAVGIVAAWFVLAAWIALVVAAGLRTANRNAPWADHLIGLPADLTVDDVVGVRTVEPGR